MSHSAPYRRIRERLIELAATFDDDIAATTVPATPLWTVKDVYAHLCGGNADILAGNLEGVTTDPWTEAQVEARRDHSLVEVINEWTALAGPFDQLIDDLDGAMDPRLFIDAWAHEQDLRALLGRPGGDEAELLDRATPEVVRATCISVRRAGLSPIAIRVGAHANQSGDDPLVRLEAEPFEFLRGTLGRRSRRQIRAWTWSGDIEIDPYIDAMLVFGIAQDDLTDAI